MSAWYYNETPEFVRDAERLELSEEVRDALKNWAESVKPVPSGRNKKCFQTPQNRFSAWNARIPDPDSNKGSSGGFRLIYFIDQKTSSIYLDKIEKRTDLGFGNERPRDKQIYEAYLSDLKQALLKLEKEQNFTTPHAHKTEDENGSQSSG
jgi:mRNA-degrading endonuclease RelE of RelBE toxin-antitoxin system